jgi:hypothetical protein
VPLDKMQTVIDEDAKRFKDDVETYKLKIE